MGDSHTACPKRIEATYPIHPVRRNADPVHPTPPAALLMNLLYWQDPCHPEYGSDGLENNISDYELERINLKLPCSSYEEKSANEEYGYEDEEIYNVDDIAREELRENKRTGGL